MLRAMNFAPQIHTIDEENRSDWRRKTGALLAGTVLFLTGCNSNTEQQAAPGAAATADAKPTIDFGGSGSGSDSEPRQKPATTTNSRVESGNIHRPCGPVKPPVRVESAGTMHFTTGCTDSDVRDILVKGFGFNSSDISKPLVNVEASKTEYSDGRPSNVVDDYISADINYRGKPAVEVYGPLALNQPRKLRASCDDSSGKRQVVVVESANDVQRNLLPKCK